MSPPTVFRITFRLFIERVQAVTRAEPVPLPRVHLPLAFDGVDGFAAHRVDVLIADTRTGPTLAMTSVHDHSPFACGPGGPDVPPARAAGMAGMNAGTVRIYAR